jgi:hypothetical protein
LQRFDDLKPLCNPPRSLERFLNSGQPVFANARCSFASLNTDNANADGG